MLLSSLTLSGVHNVCDAYGQLNLAQSLAFPHCSDPWHFYRWALVAYSQSKAGTDHLGIPLGGGRRRKLIGKVPMKFDIVVVRVEVRV